MLQTPNLKIRAPTQCFVSFSHKSHVRFLRTFCTQKAFQKPMKNHARTIEKSTRKRCFFLHRLFRIVGLILGGFGTSSWIQVGPKKRGIKEQDPLESQLITVGGFRQSLERAWAGFWEGLDRFWERSGSVWEGFCKRLGTSLGGVLQRVACARTQCLVCLSYKSQVRFLLTLCSPQAVQNAARNHG